ncbi:hypothetical protein P8452_38379 [Trifolium repens]|nr:hypothetical protein P8452_38379 [Trifolium repens]
MCNSSQSWALGVRKIEVRRSKTLLLKYQFYAGLGYVLTWVRNITSLKRLIMRKILSRVCEFERTIGWLLSVRNSSILQIVSDRQVDQSRDQVRTDDRGWTWIIE